MRLLQLIGLELKAIISDRAIAITLFGGVIFYSVLYPLPYLHQVPTQQLVVVVDNDLSPLSRELIRQADASPKLKIMATVATLADAKQAIISGKAHGLLGIPKGFERDLLSGQGVTITAAGDASYFLVYSTIAEGLIGVSQEFASGLKYQGLLARGMTAQAAKVHIHPVSIDAVPAFNLSLGYTPYVVPGLFLLILQQTLLVGTGILGAGQWRQQGYWSGLSPGQLLLGRTLAFMLIYSFFASYYVGWCYWGYGAELNASLAEVGLLMLPFLLASCLGGIGLSCLFVRRELPTQAYLISSMPILFVSGFVWPLALIPEPLVWLSQAVPAVPAIMAMLTMNQMGSGFAAIIWPYCQLWLMVLIFGMLAWLGLRYRLKPNA
ncbi:ABC transporter permease [Shewanella sp. NIFS-20-20]|uniref:ABC transporter permease n=1 Tax=Shewanella sp. NIFS-20-20 TaxID=2853806 RepID=UPI001C496F11|nr:ABC transporter permease [Shewanella sp. NIFS-20-20]MBV7315305.1 ABC transporter permease [Shewanella sp. NIFS-20-20]